MNRTSAGLMHFAVSYLTVVSVLGSNLSAADEPPIRELRTQKAGDTVYFHASLELPAEMRPASLYKPSADEYQRRMLARMPQLIPQDDNARAVYHLLVLPHFLPTVGFDARRPPVVTKGLEFVGKLRMKGKARFLLLYPTESKIALAANGAGKRDFLLPGQEPGRSWAEVPLELDFAAAKEIVAPNGARNRLHRLPPTPDDLEGLWATAQAARFALLEAQAPEFGFYGFACAATGRKYGVAAPALDRVDGKKREEIHRQLYETTTGAAAITESLQLHRLLNPDNFREKGQRTVDIGKVPGITIAEHPWEKMMAGKKPAPEPLAQWVPHDNYYVHFKNIAKFIELGELVEQWGTNAIRAYELNSRDYYLKERYERQLCLRGGWLGKTFGPAVVRGMAITGSDGYVREGSDITVIFHVANRPAFLAAVGKFLMDARKEFKGDLKESNVDYHGVLIETFATPLREVSLHRAVVDDFVIYSNSASGLRRVLDTRQGRLKALADSLDFQYMRTIFRLDDSQEDGFAFLSDAFIRQLVGPASKINEKRRLEAMTSLAMLTHGAMFAAWETGKLPESHQALLTASALKPDMLYTPEGQGVVWDPTRQAAVCDVYNTLHFPTPLVELPIDKITPAEEREYLQFRQEYLNLWRQYFDPVGMRFSFKEKQVRVETYILPMIRDSRYEFLRQFNGGGTTKIASDRFLPQTLIQFVGHLSPEVNQLAASASNRSAPLGDWISIQLDDGAEIRQLVEYLLHRELRPHNQNGADGFDELEQAIFRLPLTAGVAIGDQQAFAALLKSLQSMLEGIGPHTREHLKPAYKGITITRIQFGPESQLAKSLKMEKPAIFHAQVNKAWYVSLREDSLKQIIDGAIQRDEARKAGKESEAVDINSALYLSPAAASKAHEALGYYLEWQSHRRSMLNCPIWYSLYHAGLVPPAADEPTKKAVAMLFLGFVPVGPDGALFAYDSKKDEVVNGRHGSPARPVLHAGVESTSPLGQLLLELRTVRVDLRFREDGLHTIPAVLGWPGESQAPGHEVY